VTRKAAPRVGFTLQPEGEFLDLLDELIQKDVDYYEVAPETLWRADARGRLEPNGFHRRFAALRADTGRPFVAHGVGISMGTVSSDDSARRRAWLKQVAYDHKVFKFLWYTDHLGSTSLAGQALTLPLPLPMTRAAIAAVRRRLREMQRVVPRVGVENNVAYFMLGDALEEPAFLRAIVDAPRTHLLLDVHNLYTMSVNFSFDPERYLAGLDLRRVIEIHLSGGSLSDGSWLPSGRVMRLDSHAAAVPEEVWDLFGRILPRCPNVKGVTLERMEGTVGSGDVAPLREEIKRLRGMLS
jgi:uncharacterized protein